MIDKHRFTFSSSQLTGGDMSDPGGCTECGAYAMGVEPDATRYPCDECGENSVYGAQELMFMGLVDLPEWETE